jgi:integrase
VSLRKRITPHSLRHSYALDLLAGDPETGRAPAPLPAVSKLLGHSDPKTTMRYLAHFERRDLTTYAPTLRWRGGDPGGSAA